MDNWSTCALFKSCRVGCRSYEAPRSLQISDQSVIGKTRLPSLETHCFQLFLKRVRWEEWHQMLSHSYVRDVLQSALLRRSSDYLFSSGSSGMKAGKECARCSALLPLSATSSGSPPPHPQPNSILWAPRLMRSRGKLAEVAVYPSPETAHMGLSRRTRQQHPSLSSPPPPSSSWFSSVSFTSSLVFLYLILLSDLPFSQSWLVLICSVYLFPEDKATIVNMTEIRSFWFIGLSFRVNIGNSSTLVQSTGNGGQSQLGSLKK